MQSSDIVIQKAPRAAEADPVEHEIAWHDGDARAAIATLLDDRRHLRQQLAILRAEMLTISENKSRMTQGVTGLSAHQDRH